jgi:hypothetical protein
MNQVRYGVHRFGANSKRRGSAPRRRLCGRFWRLATGLFAILIASLATTPIHAQNADCDRIRAQIAYIDQNGGGGGSRTAQYASAAARQQAELERTANYARSLGCDRGGFSFFGAGQPLPPQCSGLNSRIQAMQANLGKLQGMAGGGGSRQDLVARYNAYCRSQPRGFFDSLFGNSGNSQPDIPLEAPPTDEQTPRGGSQAICVRTCDGGFFPLNYSARNGNLETLGELCTALCPNAEVSLYTRNPDNDVGTAVGADGTPYRDLQNAFKFQKSYDSNCTCKAKGESWVQALSQSDAERVLGQERKGDIIVTPEKSLEMSRPKVEAVRSKVQLSDPNQPAVPASATPATNSAITSMPQASPPSPDQAETQEITGPDGVKRHVRIVGPTP